MKWRCVSNIVGYCSGEPEWEEPPRELGRGEYLGSGSCKLEPETCGRFQVLTQQLEGVVLPKSQWRVAKGGRVIRRKVDKTP